MLDRIRCCRHSLHPDKADRNRPTVGWCHPQKSTAPAYKARCHADTHEKRQARSAGQPIGSGFDASNFQFLLPVIFSMSDLRVLCLLGGFRLGINLVSFNKRYRTLPNLRGLFFWKSPTLGISIQSLDPLVYKSGPP